MYKSSKNNLVKKKIFQLTFPIPIHIILMMILFMSCKNNLLAQNHSKALKYDHIVIVIEENKYYNDIIPTNEMSSSDSLNLVNNTAPYINKILRKEGANFTHMFGEEHYSEGNYFWLFSGSNQGVGYLDKIPDKNTPNYPFISTNLASELINKNLTFKGFSESLPSVGYKGNTKGMYVRKHVPWISFGNVPNGRTVATSSNLPFKDFPKNSEGFNNLPTVSFIVPDLSNDMHNGSILRGDRWLQSNINDYYQWAKTHNSLLIITFDENKDATNYNGLTNPSINPSQCALGVHKQACIDQQNKIVTIFAGAHIIKGNYAEGKGITHVNILRTIEYIYDLPRAGGQQKNAKAYGISNDYVIKDVFDKSF